MYFFFRSTMLPVGTASAGQTAGFDAGGTF
jgi:hypothetical protein